ncbi:hypothetical protein FOMPIDRAFT_1108965, partial [Fomitopsis schrenkii]
WAAAVKTMESTLITFDMTDAIAGVNVAHLTDTKSMLPIALYMCCQLDLGDILYGITREDGTVDRLAQDDVVTCIDAQRILTHRNVTSAYHILAPLTNGSCTAPHCHGALTSLRDSLLAYDGRLDDCQCLDDWMPTLRSPDLDNYFGSLCPVCRSLILTRIATERANLWSELPDIMDVQ